MNTIMQADNLSELKDAMHIIFVGEIEIDIESGEYERVIGKYYGGKYQQDGLTFQIYMDRNQKRESLGLFVDAKNKDEINKSLKPLIDFISEIMGRTFLGTAIDKEQKTLAIEWINNKDYAKYSLLYYHELFERDKISQYEYNEDYGDSYLSKLNLKLKEIIQSRSHNTNEKEIER
ncbi:MAG: hypothetical protein PHC47_01060 [Clostridia bacterium]|nr:hypothetical protein [Clostridia bacterium]